MMEIKKLLGLVLVLVLLNTSVFAYPRYATTSSVDNGDKVVLTRYKNDISIAVVTEKDTESVWCRITPLSEARWFLPSDFSDFSYLKKLIKIDNNHFWTHNHVSVLEKKIKVSCSFNNKVIVAYSIYNPEPSLFKGIEKYVFTTWVGHFVSRYWF